jgi:hypothetical protein
MGKKIAVFRYPGPMKARVNGLNARIWSTNEEYVNDIADKLQICVNKALDMNAE